MHYTRYYFKTDQLHLSLDVMQRLAQVASSNIVLLTENASVESKQQAQTHLMDAISGINVDSDDPNNPEQPTEQLASLRDTAFDHIADILKSSMATTEKIHELHYLERRLGDFAFRLDHTIEAPDE